CGSHKSSHEILLGPGFTATINCLPRNECQDRDVVLFACRILLNKETPMKKSTVLPFSGIVGMILLASHYGYAQTRNRADAGSANQQQVMQELLDEVHQLRLAVQHISVNAYRGQ